MTASNKDEFNHAVKEFLLSSPCNKPILFEVFTETDDKSNALEMMQNAVVDSKVIIKQKVKEGLKSILPDSAVEAIKKTLRK